MTGKSGTLDETKCILFFISKLLPTNTLQPILLLYRLPVRVVYREFDVTRWYS